MSNFPPNGYNTISGFNKYKGTYFNNDVDVSGGNIINRTGNLYLADNSSIYSLNNHIQFDDVYSFTNFLNSVNIFGQQKLTYNSIEYDVGNEISKVQPILDNKIGTMFYNSTYDFNEFNNIYCSGQIQYEDSNGAHVDLIPIVLSNQSGLTTANSNISTLQGKTTNISYDSGTNTTTITGLLTLPTNSINSTSINNTSFLALTGNQTITSGIKTFSTAPVLSGASITTNTIPIASVVGTAVALSGTQTITATKTFSVVQNFTSNLRLDGSLLVGTAGATIITNANLQTIPTTALKTTNQSYSSVTNQTAFSNLLEFTGTLNGFSVVNFNNAITQTLGLTSPAQTQLTTANTNISTLTNKLTNLSFTTPTTLITGTTETNVLKFNTTLNGITPTIFTYLSNVTSDIQSQFSSITTNSVSISANNIFTGLCQFSNNLQLNSALVIKTPSTSVTLSNDNLTRIQYLSTASSDIQTQLTGLGTRATTLETKTTKMSYMSVGGVNTTTILDGLITQTLSFTGTLNNISTTTFGYLSGVTSSIQTQLQNLGYAVNPVGTIIMSPLSDIQTTSGNKYLLCDGQSVGRSSYPNLFAKIGTTFGSVDPFNFNVPNYQGAFLRGYGQSMINGQIYEGNFTVNTPQQDAIQEHRHWGQTGSYCGTNRASGVTNAFFSGGYYPQTYNFDQTGLQSTGRSDSGETRPMNYSVFYYIKS